MIGKRVWSALAGCALSLCFAHPTYADAGVTLSFADEGITASQEGSGYTIEGTTLTINEAGTYELTGTCSEGSVIVGEEVDGAVLVLRDLSLSSSSTAPIVVKKSSKVQFTLEGASTLTDAEDPANETSEDASVAAAFEGAAIKVNDSANVTFDGEGSLTVKGNAKDGISGGSQAALTFKNGSYDVDAQDNGIASDGSLAFAAGTYDITAGGDGINSTPNANDSTSDGKITIDGGTFTIDAEGDGIQADSNLTINDGTLDIATQGGSKSTSFDPSTMSCMGLKASGDREPAGELDIMGGTITLDTADDAIHANGSVRIEYGTVNIKTGDDGIHGDASVIIGAEKGLARDPEITVESSYKGIEAGTVYIYSGKTWVAAQDDGINAGGASDNDHFTPGGHPDMPGQWQDNSDEYNIYIYGGDLYMDCTGDGLESSGGLYLGGGRQTILSQAMGGSDSPLDAVGVILVKGSTLYAAGTNPMGEVPSSDSQKCFKWGQKWTTGRPAGTVTTIKNGNTVLYSERLLRTINYLLYSNPTLTVNPSLFINDAFDACKSNAWAHPWSDAQPAQDADGVVVYKCSACKKIEHKTIKAQESNVAKMYRLYNPNSGEHFYTADLAERDGLIVVGWRYEGIGWIAPISSMTPVYRLYNRNAGDHHYTLDPAERDNLIGHGWIYEGIGWYSDDMQGVALYRQYNPNAVAGAHNFTTSAEERDHLVSLGWHDEGTSWYGVATDSGTSEGDDPEPDPRPHPDPDPQPDPDPDPDPQPDPDPDPQDGTEEPTQSDDPVSPTDPSDGSAQG